MSRREVYARISEWYRANIERVLGDEGEYEKHSAEYILDLPDPAAVTEEQMDEAFRHVIMNLLEWGYHDKDEHGYKMAAYAHAGEGTR